MDAFALLCAVLIAQTEGTCDQPIDLNQATLSELDSLPYITPHTAQLIMDIRPICSPLELTYSPKKITGFTQDRLNEKWNWFQSKRCSDTCCRADASCSGISERLIPISAQPTIYSWQPGAWSECTSECGKGKQYRDITCMDASNNAMVDHKYCLTIPYKPISKQVCNIMPCPIYKWFASKWQGCVVDSNGICIKKRDVFCYDTVNNIREAASKCDMYDEHKPDTTQTCDSCAHLRRAGSKGSMSKRSAATRSLLSWSENTVIGDVTVNFDLFNDNNCETDTYRNINSDTLILRRGCYMDIHVLVEGLTSNDNLDMSWFYVDATLQANTPQSDNNEWYNNYLQWWDSNSNNEGWLTINIPNDGYIGEFACNLYYQHNGNPANRQLITDFTVYILFNPYNIQDEVYMPSAVDRSEYIENEFGLIWVGSSDSHSAMQWNYDQFHFPNLQIAMNLLDRLELQYRNNLVLISRQISYAVQEDICYGRWQGSYTTGTASGGYTCTPLQDENICIEPWAWTGTTQLFDLYRDELNSQYKVQYCQCFVYAGVSTTVGRALGIPTRSTSNFQSAHDSDYNRAIDKYWILSSDGRYLSPASGQSSDSVWNFHVWNEMYFQRNDFTNSAYNHRGWQIVDATPQEYSYGGNPALANYAGAFQLGPASLALIKDNMNPHECIDASLPSSSTNKARFGCFDTEFVISETNANFGFWLKNANDPPWVKYTLQYILKTDPWDVQYGTIGALTNTKKPATQNEISDDCLNEAIVDCDGEYLDLTLAYKWREPSDPGTPTDDANVYEIGDERYRRRMMRRRRRLWSEHEYSVHDLDDEGIEYSVETIPHQWYITPMIIADDRDDIIDLYGDDYTFGMMSITIDSYHNDAFNVYCGFTLTAHDYSGQQIYLNNDNSTNGAVKQETYGFILEAGQSGACQFYVNYTEYAEWIPVHSPKGKGKGKSKWKTYSDGSETPFAFKFTISVSLFDETTVDEPYQIIIEERDLLVCSPKLKLRDRIMCHHKMRWFEPTTLDYECNGLSGDAYDSIGDGFCDDMNNIDGCYDGGDCCKSTCVPSQNYKCPPIFNCMDDRIKYKNHNQNYKKCPKISSFTNYINKIDELRESSVCGHVVNNFTCSSDIFSSDNGNQCMNAIFSRKEARLFGKIESCFDETFNSLDQEMKQIVQTIIDCANGQLPETKAKKKPAKTKKAKKKGQNKRKTKKKRSKKQTSAFSVGVRNDYNEFSDDSNKRWDDFNRSIGGHMILSIVLVIALIMSIITCILYVCKFNRKYQGMENVSYDTQEIQTDIEQYPIII